MRLHHKAIPHSGARHQSRFGRGASVLAVSLGLLFMTSLASAQSYELMPGVVVDAQARVVYTMSSEGGIDALDLDSGNIRWHSDEAQRPLASAGGELLAQTTAARPGALTIAVLDSAGRLLRSSSADLPSGVVGKVVDDLNGSFRLSAVATASGFDLSWEAINTPARGALILDDAGSTAPQLTAGSLSFDRTSGAIAQSSPVAPRVADVVVPAAQRLDGEGQQFFSVTREQILVSAMLGDLATAGSTHRWNIFSIEGKQLGQFDAFTSYAPFFVTDTAVIFQTPPHAWRNGDEVQNAPFSLRSISLSSGLEQWSTPIRDTTYRGPFPP